VGFCADLRCAAKLVQKQELYQALKEHLQLTWGQVDLICIPIGNAGTLLQSSLAALARAVATNPDNPPTVAVKALALSRRDST
jgi:hypothetical protein